VANARTRPVAIRAETRFGELAALQWGREGDPPLLALHGWLDNAASFTRLAPILADDRCVIALDLPGHGHSAHLPGTLRRYAITDQIDHVLDFAAALGLGQFDLLGHSLGGGIASLFAAAAPRYVRGLSLIESLGPLGDTGDRTLERWRAAHAELEKGRGKPRLFATLEEAVAARVEAGDLQAGEVRPIVARNVRRVENGYVWRSDPRLRLRTPLRIEEGQIRRLLAGIEADTLLLLAEPATPYLPTGLMNARAACLPAIRVERLPGPHHLHIRHPREVAAHIKKFLASI